MIENKLFAGGGLNQDADENFLKPNDWTYGLNIRNTDRQEFSDGVISNVKGNTLVTFSLPLTGTNRCIGNYANEQTGLYYSFIYNSDGYHTITEYNIKNNTLVNVLQSKTNTDGIDILNFQPYELINGVSMIGSDLLYWTDGYNPPRGISVSKSILSSYTYYTTSESISLIKQPPTEIISATYANDANTSISNNRLKKQLFQFKYLYVYDDNSRSAWSSHSNLPLPSLEVATGDESASYRNNHIILSVDAGTKYVKTIELAAFVKGIANAENTQDWYSIASIDRQNIIENPLNYGYDLGSNQFIFKFYNDVLYQGIDIRESDLQYDFVPLKSKTLDIVNGNVLVLGNNTEGYDNVNINATLSTSYVESTSNRLSVEFTVGDTIDSTTQIFTGIPVVGDEIDFQWTAYNPSTQETSDFSFYYIVPSELSGDILGTLNAFGQFVADTTSAATGYFDIGFIDVTPSGGGYSVNFAQSFSAYLTGIQMNLAEGFADTESSYKTNSKYEFGLVYYDEFNRSTYVQTNSKLAVTTESWGSVSGKSPVFDWEVNSNSPEWATTYQWVRTEELTHKKFLFWGASGVTTPVTGNYSQIHMNSFYNFNTNNPESILSYEYTPGDRCTVHKIGSSWKTNIDLQVVGFDYAASGVTLNVSKNTNLSAATGTLLIEIYTPKLRSNTSTEQFFYEFGEVYSCSGGVHSVTSGTFKNGDVYRKDRVQYDRTESVESQGFSDFYSSNFSSNGRTNIFAPQAKQLTLPTDIRYSDTYVPNTNINGLTRFYGDAYETYDRVNGSIQKIAVRDNYLITFQELKTGYIPINQSIIEDQGVGNAANVAISNRLLNKIRYYASDYGIGLHPESFSRFAGTMYFADTNRGVIIKLADGLQPISMIGMDSYFTQNLSKAASIANTKILGSYDPRNDEYIVSIKYASPDTVNKNETIAFNELINRWTTFYSFLPDFGGYIFNQYITYQNGAMYLHNVNSTYNSFYGSTYTSSVQLVYNQSPLLVKTFIGIMEQSNSVWELTDIFTSRNQTSELPDDYFTEKEGVFFGSFLREKTGDPMTLYFGDDLKGNWIKFTASNASTAKISLLSVDVRHIPSYQGIK